MWALPAFAHLQLAVNNPGAISHLHQSILHGLRLPSHGSALQQQVKQDNIPYVLITTPQKKKKQGSNQCLSSLYTQHHVTSHLSSPLDEKRKTAYI